MEPRYDATQIANWFITWARDDEADISNLKVQKLLYYAQGHHLARFDAPLFRDRIEAWSHGPVVASVYHLLKDYGSGDVAPIGSFDLDEIDERTGDFLEEIWNSYGAYAAWTLRDMTHREAPWRETFEKDRNHAITPERLSEYFAAARLP